MAARKFVTEVFIEFLACSLIVPTLENANTILYLRPAPAKHCTTAPPLRFAFFFFFMHANDENHTR